MSETTAADTLMEVERVRSVTRAQMNESWFPFLLWGVLVTISAAMTQIGDGNTAVAVFWVVASPAGVTATTFYYRRREVSLGLLDRHGWLYFSIAVSMAIGAALVGALASGTLSDVGPSYPIALGLLVFGGLLRSSLIIATAAALAAVTTVLLIVAPGDAALYAALSQGAILLAAGFAALLGTRLGGAGRGPRAVGSAG